MGVSSSSIHDDETSPPPKALHVLRVTNDSPASLTDLEPFFDFIVGIDGDELASHVDAATLGAIVERAEGKILPLVVWSAKYQSMRVVEIVPSRTWSQDLQGLEVASEEPPSLLGLSMRLCTPAAALDNVWHILEVMENSPAEAAGLVPYGDWILGWSGGALAGENAFSDIVEAHVDKPLRIMVYSYDFDTIREVVLVPNRKWGGEGLIGCSIGFGLLHRIPPQPMDQDTMDTILKQNLPYDEQDPFDDQQNPRVERTTLFVPADDDNFEYGGASGIPRNFDSYYPDESNQLVSPREHRHSHRGHTHGPEGHSHSHEHGDDDHHGHSHMHSHPPPQNGISASSVASPPRVPTALQHSTSVPYTEISTGIKGPLRMDSFRRMSGSGIVRHGSGAMPSSESTGSGTPTRVKSPVIGDDPAEDDHPGNDQDQPYSPGGSVTSVD